MSVFLLTEDTSDMVDRVSMPCSSLGDTDSYSHPAVDSFPSTLSGLSVVSNTGSRVTDISRSHTPPERDVNSNKSSCMSDVGVGSTAENVAPQGVFKVCLTAYIFDRCYALALHLISFLRFLLLTFQVLFMDF